MQPCSGAAVVPAVCVLRLHGGLGVWVVGAATVAYCEYVPFTPVMIWWFNRLKASAENSRYVCSYTGTLRDRRKSKLLKPGMGMLLRPICGGRPVVADPELELIVPP